MAERKDDGGHELRLEGVGLVLGGGVLLALIVGAFFLGRWVERQRPPAGMAAAVVSGPLSEIMAREGTVDAEEGLGGFDDAPDAKQPAEPERELKREEPAPEPAAERDRQAPPPDVRSDGAFFVQVAAVRDPTAAAELIEGLKRKGYPARIFSEGGGQERLYKVRVGGYPSREAAGAARDRLRADGSPGAFLWPSG